MVYADDLPVSTVEDVKSTRRTDVSIRSRSLPWVVAEEEGQSS